MSILRTINHPDVEIRERDISQIAPAIVGTNFLIAGFTDKGEEFERNIIGSMSDYSALYGTPTNEAERYHYYTTREVIRNNGTAICIKLPYDNTMSDNYKSFGINIAASTAIGSGAPSEVQELTGTEYGYTSYQNITTTPVSNIPRVDYDTMKVGGWPTTVSDDFVVINEIKAAFGGPDEREGLFVVLVDPQDALAVQKMLPNSTDDDVMDVFQGIAGIPLDAYSEAPTGLYKDSSTSEKIQRHFPTIDYLEGGDKINPEYSQNLGLIVCKQFYDRNGEEFLSVAIVEAFVGSIIKGKTNKATGLTENLVDIVNGNSQYIKIYQNPMMTVIPEDTTTILYHQNQSYEMMGFTKTEAEKIIDGNEVVTNLNTAFQKVDNILDVQIDVAVDAGLSSIAQFTDEVSIYDPVNDLDANDRVINQSSDIATWRMVVSALEQFCSKTRKDCMTILDTPRHMVLIGNEKRIRKTAPDKTFSNTIGQDIRYVTGINSSYAALYSNWFAMVDEFTGVKFWIPETLKVAGIYAYNDTTANIWDAPAGLNRGIVDGVYDLSFNPKAKDMDALYTKSINYAVKYPLDGFIVEGQKTTQVKPSAFDRVNVRRLFLRLERATYRACRYFVYEPNNLFTRRRLIDVLTPMFQATKAAGGLYDYRIICDETNNTPEVIDHNELKVAILLKPVRTAEFILVDFIATRTDANFDEIIQEI
jgi:phage tail sheath protein FI